MNNEEAKFILQGYRPNGTDAADTAFQAALEQVQRDPALREWFARQQAFDAAVSAKLNAVPAPAGLREAILAGGRVTAPDPARAGWWRQPVWMAAAAGIAVAFATAFALWPQPAMAGATLPDFALADARYSATHGGHTTEPGSLQALLSEPTTRLGHGLPVNLAALRKAGCRTLSFEGREVFEVCFKREGLWFHCYIAQRADFPSMAAALAPVLSGEGGVALAAWADAAHLFVVVSKSGRAPLEKLL
jgi:hypothetical protein